MIEAYKRSFKVTMDIFWLTLEFTKEEIYSLTSQVTRSSRSISANIVAGWPKRHYESIFKQHLIHSVGSCSATENWMLFALECQYIDKSTFDSFQDELDQIGKMLNKLHQNWKSNGK